MRIPKKRCLICHQWFSPDPRTADHQEVCSKPACQKQRKARTDRSWRIRHPEPPAERLRKVRDWARNYPHFWQHYRATHPDYVQRDNVRRRLARHSASRAAKQDLSRQIAVERLEGIRQIGAGNAAKQDVMARRIEGLVDYLLWKEGAAKHNLVALQNPGE